MHPHAGRSPGGQQGPTDGQLGGQKTMKGADKAIVAKSFGKWKSSSLRSRTMEKPDEPSEESKEESLSNCTCEAPQLGKKPVGKSTLFSYFKSVHTAVSPSLFFLWQF
ncbi:hypothetical protein INR49_010642 [Caranx melampygus]|nr:hypothetical protein INR49_010642 [Caranx melampygus]